MFALIGTRYEIRVTTSGSGYIIKAKRPFFKRAECFIPMSNFTPEELHRVMSMLNVALTSN